MQTARLPSKKVINRDFKNLNEKAFLEDFKLKKLSRKSDNSNENYEFFHISFNLLFIKCTPQNQNCPTEEYFYNRSVLRNKFLKDNFD